MQGVVNGIAGVTSAGGVQLAAPADALALPGGATIQAGGAVVLSGSAVTIDGSVIGPTLAVRGGPGTDALTLAPTAAPASVEVDGGGGPDAIRVRPLAGTEYAVAGQGAARLDVDLAAAAGPVLSATFDPARGFTGAWGFADRGAVRFTDVGALTPTAELSVRVVPLTAAVAGQVYSYTVEVKNGQSAVAGVRLTDVLPAWLGGVSWSTAAVGGASVSAVSGLGAIDVLLDLPAGGQVTFTVTGVLDPAATGELSHQATVTPPAVPPDLNPADNVGTAAAAITPLVLPPPPVAPPPPPLLPPPPPPPVRPSPLLVGWRELAVGSDAGTAAQFRFLAPGPSDLASGPALGGFTGGARVAAADFNGDGVADRVLGTGPGGVSDVRVIDGKTGAELFAVQPFEVSFTGGVYVAAGDLTGDGVADLVITPDEGGGPRVRIFSGNGFRQVADFFGIDDPNFRGGARAAVGDVDGDGVGDLVVAAGFGGGPRVAVFNGTTVPSNAPTRLFGDFFAFEPALRNGAFVTAGDVNGDGFADLVAGGGPGGGPRVLALSGPDLLARPATEAAVLANFFAGDVTNRGGVRVAVKDLDGDDRADVVAGAGTGAGSRVTAYLGCDLPAGPAEHFALDAFPGFAGGVFVG